MGGGGGVSALLFKQGKGRVELSQMCASSYNMCVCFDMVVFVLCLLSLVRSLALVIFWCSRHVLVLMLVLVQPTLGQQHRRVSEDDLRRGQPVRVSYGHLDSFLRYFYCRIMFLSFFTLCGCFLVLCPYVGTFLCVWSS